MNGGELQNANPIIYDVAGADGDGADGLLGGKGVPAWLAGFDDDDDTDADGSSSSSSDGGGPGGGGGDPYDADEVFEILRRLRDPEHPLTLEQLNVIARENISLDDAASRVAVRFTPTVPHCSMATLIGLCIRVKLLRSLPRRFKVTVTITPGAHASEHAVNKQLADKERVAAALENKHLLDVVDKCIAKTDEPSDALLALARAPLFVDPGAKEPFLYDGLLQ